MKWGLRMLNCAYKEPLNKFWVKTEKGIESWSSPDDTITGYKDINDAHRSASRFTSKQEIYWVEELPNPPSIAAWKKSLGQ